MHGPSHRMKDANLPIVIERDGLICLYCKLGFTDTNQYQIDHLNDDTSDNRPENWCLCHRSCNNRKKFSPEFQLIAKEKLKENEKTVSVRERTHAHLKVEHPEGLTSSQQISYANKPIAKEWLYNHIMEEGQVTQSEVVPAIADILEKRTGTGSQQAVRNYINSWCNRYTGEFTKTKEAGKFVIRIRNEN